jgi:hypothetical protein
MFICTEILGNVKYIVPASKISLDGDGKVNMKGRNGNIYDEQGLYLQMNICSVADTEEIRLNIFGPDANQLVKTRRG